MKVFTVDIRKVATGSLVASESFATPEEAFNACAERCKNNPNVSMGWPGYEDPRPYYAETGVAEK